MTQRVNCISTVGVIQAMFSRKEALAEQYMYCGSRRWSNRKHKNLR